MSNKNYDFLYKILLIGDSGVGKTSIMLAYVDGIFSNTFISTIGIDFKIKTVELDGKKIKVQIWDTAGQERFHTITTSYYRSAMGVLLVYDVCERRTFSNVTRWLDNLSRFADQQIDVVMVANKIDIEHKRVITNNEGYQLACLHKVKYAESSAKYRDTIEKIFNDMIQRIYDFQNNHPLLKDSMINDLESEPGRNNSCCSKS